MCGQRHLFPRSLNPAANWLQGVIVAVRADSEVGAVQALRGVDHRRLQRLLRGLTRAQMVQSASKDHHSIRLDETRRSSGGDPGELGKSPCGVPKTSQKASKTAQNRSSKPPEAAESAFRPVCRRTATDPPPESFLTSARACPRQESKRSPQKISPASVFRAKVSVDSWPIALLR